MDQQAEGGMAMAAGSDADDQTSASQRGDFEVEEKASSDIQVPSIAPSLWPYA